MLTADQVRVVPFAAVLPDGRSLPAFNLCYFKSPRDNNTSLPWRAQLRVRRAVADNFVLCLLPLPGEQTGKFGISIAEALDEVWRDPARVVAVAPYDHLGEPLVCYGTDLRMFWAEGPVNGLQGAT